MVFGYKGGDHLGQQVGGGGGGDLVCGAGGFVMGDDLS